LAEFDFTRFRNLFICDFDHIERSSLSRTVRFAPGDIGRSKAHTAAERARTLCLTPDHRIVSFHRDITSRLGLGVFQTVDIVLGCVDNVEARRFINRICRWLWQAVDRSNCRVAMTSINENKVRVFRGLFAVYRSSRRMPAPWQ